MKERNRIATSNMERERLKAGYGEAECLERDRVVSTMNNSHVPFPILMQCEIIGSVYPEMYQACS